MPGEEANAVGIKLPGFWTKNAAAWFAQAEAQFHVRKITQDETKYYHVIASLDAETATRASAIIQRPPGENKYDTLKRFLLSAFEPTEAERANKLLNLPELGDRRPSELMDYILYLNGDKDQHFILKHIFLNALPEAVRNLLATSPEEDLRKLAQQADECYSIVRSKPSTVWQVQDGEADAVFRRQKRQLCYWHRRFKKAAWKCEQPCDWQQQPPKRTGNGQGGPC